MGATDTGEFGCTCRLFCTDLSSHEKDWGKGERPVKVFWACCRYGEGKWQGYRKGTESCLVVCTLKNKRLKTQKKGQQFLLASELRWRLIVARRNKTAYFSKLARKLSWAQTRRALLPWQRTWIYSAILAQTQLGQALDMNFPVGLSQWFRVIRPKGWKSEVPLWLSGVKNPALSLLPLG